jgi:hypothetical protein
MGEVVCHLVPREEPRRTPLVAALTVATALAGASLLLLTGSSVGVVALAGVALVTLTGVALVATLLLLVTTLVALLLLVVALVLVVVASGTGGGGDKSCGVKLAWSSKTMKTDE